MDDTLAFLRDHLDALARTISDDDPPLAAAFRRLADRVPSTEEELRRDVELLSAAA